jgi:beta-phosphoglucomutase-like phosphatase (HAD superfamily)
VLQRLNLPANVCLALEDSGNGIRSSLGAGIPTLVTETDYTRDHDFSGALAVLPDLATADLSEIRRYFDHRL